MPGRFREEVLNVHLALLLNRRGLVTVPELSVRSREDARRLPDVLVVFQGLRLVLEGKYDTAGAAEALLAQTAERVEQGVAHIAVAVLYPPPLGEVAFDDLGDALTEANLRIAVTTEAGASGWSIGDLEFLTDLLRRTFEGIVQEDVVGQAVFALEAGVANFSRVALRLPGVVERSAEVLGIAGPP